MYQDKFSQAPDMSELNQKKQMRTQVAADKKAHRGKVLFYAIYGGFVAAFLIALICILIPLHNWLVRYEASQPERKAQEVFTQLFEDPDWAALYSQCGMQNTVFETKETFSAYMTDKVGQTPLTYLETSAGLSNDHKYIVRLGEEKVATFRLTGGTNEQTEIAQWELGAIELFFDRSHSVTVEKHPSYTVYINGHALDSSYTICTVSTKAEEYLPEGVMGYRMEQQYVDNLLQAPQVTATDKDGNPIEMVLDAQTGIYKPQTASAPSITEEEKALAIEAAKADAAFAIRAISTADLRKYFDSQSQVYKDICGTYPFLQDYKSYSFVEDKFSVTDYYRYSDSLFSVRVSLQMNIVRGSYSSGIKEVSMSKTYFFTKNSAGKYLVTQYTNIPVQEQVTQVRLTFKDGEALLGTQMVSTNATVLTPPQVVPAEGQVLQGWATRSVDENGKITMTILFTPDENGNVLLSSETALTPMTLYPIYETKEEPK